MIKRMIQKIPFLLPIIRSSVVYCAHPLIWFYYQFYVTSGGIILYYHNVTDNPEVKSLSRVSVQLFEKQMKFLNKAKFNIVTLDSLVELVRSQSVIAPKTIALCFDDGFRDNFLNAFPILKKFSVPATIFIVTDYISTKRWFSYKNMKNASEPEDDSYYPVEYLRWEDMDIMSTNGISIASHSATHPIFENGEKSLTVLSDEKLEYEIITPKHTLYNRWRTMCPLFAYPCGDYNQHVKEILQKAGYRAAFTSLSGRLYPGQDLYALPRCPAGLTMYSFIRNLMINK